HNYVEECEKSLMEVIFRLMESPGPRIAAAEAAVGRFIAFCDEAGRAYSARLQEQAVRTEKAWQAMEAGLEACIVQSESGRWGFGSFLGLGTKSRRALRVFMDLLTACARQCLMGESLAAAEDFFTLLCGQLKDRLRELSFCRQRLHHARESLSSALKEIV